jgi:hypothetical protein
VRGQIGGLWSTVDGALVIRLVNIGLRGALRSTR